MGLYNMIVYSVFYWWRDGSCLSFAIKISHLEDGFPGRFYETHKEEIIPTLHILPENKKKKENILPT